MWCYAHTIQPSEYFVVQEKRGVKLVRATNRR
jgi:hypothetical protein